MSIIGVVNMVVERTVFSSTNGTAPSAGVDVEPYLPTFEVTNVSFIDCQASNNSGPGFAFYISHFKNTTAPFSILLSNYTIASGHNFGISIDFIAPGVKGSMMVVNSSVRNTRFSPLAIIDKAAPDSSVTIRGCSFEANSPVTNPACNWTSPISFIADQGCHRATGGVTFEDVTVHDTRNRPWLYSEVEPGLRLTNVTGTGLTVSNPNGCAQSGPLKLAAKCVTGFPQLMTFVREIGDEINASRSAWSVINASRSAWPVKTDDGNVGTAAAAPNRIPCIWNVDSHNSPQPNGTLLPALSTAIQERFDHNLLIIYQDSLGHYPQYATGAFPGGLPGRTTQVGLASCFRDLPFSPLMNGSVSHCSKCAAPLLSTFVEWRQNYARWMTAHRAQLAVDLSVGTAGIERNGSVPHNWTGPVVIDWEYWRVSWQSSTETTNLPCCRFPGYAHAQLDYRCPVNGTGPCTGQWGNGPLYHWALFVSNISTPGFDKEFTGMVDWTAPTASKGWNDLTPCQQLELLRQSYDHFARDFYTQTLDTLSSLRPRAKWGFWGIPRSGFPSLRESRDSNSCEEGCSAPLGPGNSSSCGYNGPGTDGLRWQQQVNDDLNWLWAKVGVLVPDLYSRGFVQDSGAPVCGPTKYPDILHWTQKDNQIWLDSTLVECARIRDAQPNRPALLPYFWWHFTWISGSCSKNNTFTPLGNVVGFFESASKLADGMVLWGTLNAPDSLSHVAAQVEAWAPTIAQYCTLASAFHSQSPAQPHVIKTDDTVAYDASTVPRIFLQLGGAQIVLPTKAQANCIEIAAALELQSELALLSNLPSPALMYEPTTVSDDRASTTRIFVGRTAARLTRLNASTLQPEESVIVTDGADLFVFGDDLGAPVPNASLTCNGYGNWGDGKHGIGPSIPRCASAAQHACRAGTFFGAAMLLREHLGLRWIWPGGEGVFRPAPASANLTRIQRSLTLRSSPQLALRRIRHNPLFGKSEQMVQAYLGLYHGTSWLNLSVVRRQEAEEPLWMLRNGLGGRAVVPWGQAFMQSWAQYGTAHPDWFALHADGTRGCQTTAHCKINPAEVKIDAANAGSSGLIQHILSTFKPGTAGVSACEDDGSEGFCTCSKCSALDPPGRKGSATGAFSDRYTKFWNDVHRALRQSGHPEAWVGAYAYSRYRDPPVRERFDNESKVLILSTAFGSCLDQDNDTLDSRASWAGWVQAGAKAMAMRPNSIWNEYTGLPFVFSRQWLENVRWCGQQNMLAADFDALVGDWAAVGPSYYALARTLWNPATMNISAVLDEYYSAYGTAAEPMRHYHDFWQQYTQALYTNPQVVARISSLQTRGSKDYVGSGRFQFLLAGELYPQAVLTKAGAVLAKAEVAACAGSAGSMACIRVRKSVTHLAYVKLLGKASNATAAVLKGNQRTGTTVTVAVTGIVGAGRALLAMAKDIAAEYIVNTYYTLAKSNELGDLLGLQAAVDAPAPELGLETRYMLPTHGWLMMLDPGNLGTSQKWWAANATRATWPNTSIGCIQYGTCYCRQGGGCGSTAFENWQDQHNASFSGVSWWAVEEQQGGLPLFGAKGVATHLFTYGRAQTSFMRVWHNGLPLGGCDSELSCSKPLVLKLPRVLVASQRTELVVAMNSTAAGTFRRIYAVKQPQGHARGVRLKHDDHNDDGDGGGDSDGDTQLYVDPVREHDNAKGSVKDPFRSVIAGAGCQEKMTRYYLSTFAKNVHDTLMPGCATALKTDDDTEANEDDDDGGDEFGPWSGPAAQFDLTHDGLPVLVVDGKAQPPLWLTLHTYASTDKGQGLLDNFDDQIRRAAAEGLNVVCICLTSDVHDFGSHGTAWLSDAQPLGNWSRKIFDKVIEINPKATFIIRFYSQQPDLPDIVMLNMTDGNRTDIGNTSGRSPYDPGVMNSLTLKWVASASSRMSTMLRYLDKTYPRRVVGVFPCFLHTSEWFMPGPGDLSTHVHLSDYSEATEKQFCAETDPGNASCKLPLPSQRVKPALGSAFADVQTTKLNQYFSDCIVDAIEALSSTAKLLSGGKLVTMAFYGYLFELAGTRLAGSGHLALHKLLESPHTDGIVSPYTYLNLARNNSLGPLMAHGPWDAAPLHGKLWITEDDSHLVLVSDCNNSISGRAPDTLCCCTTPQRRSRANQSADLMRRNIFTSLMHGNAMYLYDLGAAGWFGRADMKPESDIIWGGISRALSAIYGSDTRQQLSLSDGDGDTLVLPPLLQPEIAVFVSDVSETTRTINGDNMGALLQEMLHIPPSIIASVGAPARMFVLSDLLTPGVDWSSFKFCIFLNAFVIPQNLLSAIDAKLRIGNKTLLWTYAAGVFATATDPRDALNVSRVSEIVGMPLTRGPGGRQLQIHVPASASLQAGFPRDYGASAAAQPNPIDPWFYLDNETVAASTAYEVLGRYKQQTTPHAVTTTISTTAPQQCPPVHVRIDCPGPPDGRAGCLARGCCYNNSGPGPWCSHYSQQGEVALVRRVHSDHTVVFSGSPGLPVQLWTALAASAGVHMYVDNRHCDLTPASWQVADVVEAHGNQLMVHASAACSGDQRLPRVVTLPHVAACVRDEANETVCIACRTFATAPMFAGEVQLYTIIMNSIVDNRSALVRLKHDDHNDDDDDGDEFGPWSDATVTDDNIVALFRQLQAKLLRLEESNRAQLAWIEQLEELKIDRLQVDVMLDARCSKLNNDVSVCSGDIVMTTICDLEAKLASQDQTNKNDKRLHK
jgi:hypothetical protein